MCGRFTREYTWRQVHDFLDLAWPSPDPELPPSYNVAPTQASAIVRLDASGRRWLRVAEWGLIPMPGAAPGSSQRSTLRLFNARAESLAERPAFRQAFEHRRCVVPVSAFYEWQEVLAPEDGAAGAGAPREAVGLFGQALPPSRTSRAPRRPTKQPWVIRRRDGQPLCLAGLWEERIAPAPDSTPTTGDRPVSLRFTIVTTAANAFMAHLHHRMPVILEPAQLGRWLDVDGRSEALLGLLAPAADDLLAASRVSTRVNNVAADGPELIEAVR